MTDENGPQDAVVIERTFDAPVGLIWQMWTDPDHFAAWYGPDGATIPWRKWTCASVADAWSAWRCQRRSVGTKTQRVSAAGA
jgi:uncharacterized protein YndB with AHSA1/START domain